MSLLACFVKALALITLAMAGLSSSSTVSDAQAQYRNNLTYEASGSVAMANLLVEACLFLLEAKFSEAGKGTENLRFDPQLLENRLSEARRWINANGGASAAGFAGRPRVLTAVGFSR